MKHWEYRAVTYDSAVYCTDCLPKGQDIESSDVWPIMAGSEWDSYPVCDLCHSVHDYVGLTDEGLRYEGVDG